MSGGESVRFRWERAFRGAAIGSASVLAVGLTLATYADTDGASIFPGQRRLAHDLGLSRSTIQGSQDRLEELGWISRRGTSNRKAGKAQEWRLAFPVKASPVMPRDGVKASPVTHQQTIYTSPANPPMASAGSSPSRSLSEAEIVALIAQAPSFDDDEGGGKEAEESATLPKPPPLPEPVLNLSAREERWRRSSHEWMHREEGRDRNGEPIKRSAPRNRRLR